MPAILCSVLIGLTTSLAVADEKKPDIQGTSSKIRANDAAGKTGSMLVEAPKGAKFAFDKAMIRVDAKTKIEKANGDKFEEAKFTDIKEGTKVSVWITGPVAESYPVQATAGRIVIHADKEPSK